MCVMAMSDVHGNVEVMVLDIFLFGQSNAK